MEIILNKEQQKAITTLNGHIIIKAGPGTGKTKTLTTRIEYLITEKKVSPSSILALTFTRKAAAEMRERLAHLVEVPTISTFHAFAYDILKKAGFSFEIISDHDRNEIIQSIVENRKGKEGTKKEVREVSSEISKYKNNFCLAELCSASRKNLKQVQDDRVGQYDNQLKMRNLVDYDDLILILYRELQQENNQIVIVTKNIEHVFVDEFQDTNRLQYEVIKRLGKPENLFVIGDPYQSIYSFRGADSGIFQQIRTDFPQAAEVTLQDNYRSAAEIIRVSSSLFPELVPLTAHTATHGTIQIVTTCDEFTEGQYVLKIINKNVGGTDLLKTDNVSSQCIRFSDIAVVYRTHHIGKTLQRIFLDSGIPFQVIGEESPYKQPEIAFIISVVHYSIERDDQSLQSVLYSPLLTLPRTILRTIGRIQTDKKTSYHEAVRRVCGQEFLRAKERSQLSTIISNIKKIVEAIKDKNISDSIHIVCEQFKIEASINLQQLCSCALQYDAAGGSRAFINYMSYLDEHEFYDPRADKVTLMTMHASKGLEFQTVCICGFEEGDIPSGRSGNAEEEKRLFYVALTRAKQDIHIIYPQFRMKEKKDISSFYNILSTNSLVTHIEDEAITARRKKIEKWKEKKSQLSLF